MTEDILHRLQERVKELTALHRTARILQDVSRPPQDVMSDIVNLLPPAWQYPEITSARIRFRDLAASTPNYRESMWRQSATFQTRGGTGGIDIFYSEPCPESDEGPFLKEERDLIESLAEMLRSYFHHIQSDEALRLAHDNLELVVAARTEELQSANAALEENQRHLRRLTSELAVTEARERRAIAEDLHDHLGQSLAFIKMNISQFRGNAVFCGFEGEIDKMLSLLDQAIQYTRHLTVVISPPVLYDLGLGPAIEWLGEQFDKQHGLVVDVKGAGDIGDLREEIRITLFKAVQELLTNVVKHAKASRVTVRAGHADGELQIRVRDDGVGFDVRTLAKNAGQNNRFGLFNVQERMQYCGGRMEIDSKPGSGCVVLLGIPAGKRRM